MNSHLFRLILIVALAASPALAQTAPTKPGSAVPKPNPQVQTTAPPARTGSLRWTAKVPKAPPELPLLKLTSQPAPIDLVTGYLARSRNRAKLAPLADAPLLQKNEVRVPPDVLGVVEAEHIRAWVDRRTGDAAIYPTLSSLRPLSQDAARRLAERAAQEFNSPAFLARDDTRFTIDRPQALNGATLVRDANGRTHMERPSAPYLVYVAARRSVNGFGVDGPGSRALLALDAQGSIEGLTRVWKSAKTVEKVRSSLSPEQVHAEIARQLQPALRDADVVVDRIDLAYYDANRDYLQPVYRFTARIHQRGQSRPRTNDNFVIGYIPYAKAYEPLPILGERGEPQPQEAQPGDKPATEPRKAGIDPLVGRYVVRNDDSGWVNDANAFWDGLAGSWASSTFTNSQYYWAQPWEFTSSKDSFINSVQLALIEVHGDWWLYSTLKNCCDLVNINGDIPSPGYGPSAGGRLADWVIHSCEVVPAPPDTGQWPDPWWTVFGGVRNVVGYRTIMYISDGAGGPYASSLGRFAPVVSSWLNTVMSLGAYGWPWYPHANAHGGINRPMGRPSSISMCGHDTDSVFSTSSLSRANCLTVWWFND